MNKILRSIRSIIQSSGSTIIPGKPMKMVIVVRTDLRMTKGKTAAQCSHAAVLCFNRLLNKYPDVARQWIRLGQPKVVLQVDTLDALQMILTNAQNANIITEMVRDAGRTQLETGTITAIGLGPDYNVHLDAIVKHLRLL